MRWFTAQVHPPSSVIHPSSISPHPSLLSSLPLQQQHLCKRYSPNTISQMEWSGPTLRAVLWEELKCQCCSLGINFQLKECRFQQPLVFIFMHRAKVTGIKCCVTVKISIKWKCPLTDWHSWGFLLRVPSVFTILGWSMIRNLLDQTVSLFFTASQTEKVILI